MLKSWRALASLPPTLQERAVSCRTPLPDVSIECHSHQLLSQMAGGFNLPSKRVPRCFEDQQPMHTGYSFDFGGGQWRVVYHSGFGAQRGCPDP